ncbi:MAG: ABC transporter permease [Faecousia sp.]
MIKYIMKRLLWMIPVVLGVTIFIFSIMYLMPGDATSVMFGADVPQEAIEAKKEALGLNDGYFERLLRYLEDVFIHFDFGNSIVDNTSIKDQLLLRLPKTMILAFSTILLGVVIGIPLGTVAAVKQNTWVDRCAMTLSLLGISIPGFWLGLMLVIVFAVKLNWFPAFGIGSFKHYVLPCLANSVTCIALVARHTRSAMVEVLRSDYLVAAKAKGLSQFRLIFCHALPNALLPIITVLGTALGAQMAGALVIENIFGIPGVGSYVVSAIGNRDFSVVQGAVIFLSIIFSFIMLVTDLLYAFADPRIKAQFSKTKK